MNISLPSGARGTVLVVCEKPSVARDLASVFGGGAGQSGYIPFPLGYISWAVGHMVEQAPPHAYDEGWKGWKWETLPMVPPGNLFKTEVKDSCRSQLAVLKQLYGKSDILVNACDAGREGELIFWEIVRHCGWGGNSYPPSLGEKPYFRFWAQSNTPEGLQEAWRTMKSGDQWLGLASSAYCRSESDWLLGMNLSRAATLTFPLPQVNGKKGFWSVGRVQTPVLALLVDRDAQISSFVPKPYYEVRLSFGEEAFEDCFDATLLVPEGVAVFDDGGKDSKGFRDRVDAQAALDRVQRRLGQVWEVEDEVKEGKENPPPLFSLTDLQKWCNQNWGWEAKRTLDAAQAAYETAKTLSYPRTDSSFLPEDSVQKMEGVYDRVFPYMSSRLGGPLGGFSPKQSPRRDWLFDNSKVSDHYAIVPTGEIPSDLESDAGRVWLAVARRFLVSFSAPALYSSVRRRLFFADEEGRDVALALGKVYTQRGWLDLERSLSPLTGTTVKSDPESLPSVGMGQGAPLRSSRLHEGKTTPPKHYTEATLLSVMENIHNRLGTEEEELREAISRRGIGTPATRAAIIELLLGRGYLTRVKKGSTVFLCASSEGASLVDALRSVDLGALTDPILTAEWEQKLVAMERGQYLRGRFMEELVQMVSGAVGRLRGSCGRRAEESSPGLCPLTQRPVLDKGAFWEFPGAEGVRFYKQIASRDMSFLEMSQVVLGEGPSFSGFVSKKGQKFSAVLKWDKAQGKVVFDFPEPSRQELSVLCPKSGKPVKDGGSFWEFPGVSGRFWKTVAKRVMSVEEYLVLVRDGKTEVLAGFTASSGKPFSAALVLEAGGKVGFSFPARTLTPGTPGMPGPGKKAKGKK